jgi:hypothetical protein
MFPHSRGRVLPGISVSATGAGQFMAMLARGNTDFRAASSGWAPHTKSAELETLLRAIEAVQADAPSSLEALYRAMTAWVRTDPKEVKKRASLLLVLREELEQKASGSGTDLTTLSDDFDRAAGAWAVWALMRGRLKDVHSALLRHYPTFRNIEITDRPTGAAGQYAFTDGNAYSEADRNLAVGETPEGGGHKQDEPRYWLRLGRRVVTPQQDGTCYGRCFSCAAAAIYTMVMDPAFDGYLIEHVGATSYDHHLVLLGRPNATGTKGEGLDTRASWTTKTVVVDIWQGNLNGNDDFVGLASMNTYAASMLRFFCAFPTRTRSADREFAARLLAPERGVIKKGIREQAQAALREQGSETRNVKVDGKWVIEELVGGEWVRK